MENYFFIPINSLNFNNILSSESLSPPSFYEKRGFGFKRFERINANPLSNSILGYSKILNLEPPKSDREEFPIFLAVPKSYFSSETKEFSTDNVSIIQTDASVHFNWKECFFVVKSDSDRKKLASGTKRSLEVKHSDSYLKSIFLVDEYSFKTINWNESILDTINDFKNPNQNEITRDQKINKLKGFVYGYVSGKLKEQPDELTAGKRYFQDFVNSFSALMNELSVLSNDSKKNSAKVDTNRIKSEVNHLINLKEKISILFGGNEQIEIENTLKESFKIDSNQIEFFKTCTYRNTKNSIFSIVTSFLKEKENKLYTIDELMETLIQKSQLFLKHSSTYSYKSLDETFNSYRVLISSKISSYENEAVSSSSFDTIPFSVGNDYSISNLELDELNSIERKSFSIISNELLSRLELSSTDEIAQQRLDIIQSIAKNIDVLFNKDSEELAFLRRLYLSLKTVGVGFKINETSNSSLQSLACFLSRYNEMDKLQDFMEKNGFKNYGLTYALWGSAYGYANISKILLEPLDANETVLNTLCNYISSFIINSNLSDNQIQDFLSTLKNVEDASEQKSPTIEWSIEKENSIDSRHEATFLEQIKSNDTLNKNLDWIEVITRCYNKVFDENTLGALFDDAYKIKEFDRLLKEEKSKGNLNRFGDAKINEVNKIFSKTL